MEKEKKPRARKKAATTITQMNTAETTSPKKTVTRKKSVVTEISANGTGPKKIAAPKKIFATPTFIEPKVTQMKVSHEEIARLAHHYWVERGYQHGNSTEDWLRAERELRGKAS